jgi:hypothetical protein
MKTKHDPKMDEYIDEAEKFAQPVLKHLRKLVHQACPDIEEAIKWNMPFFVHDKGILCFMAAFKAHCGFGFWGPKMRTWLKKEKVGASGSMGNFGRITSRKDLPSDKVLLRCIRQAVKFKEAAKPARSQRMK